MTLLYFYPCDTHAISYANLLNLHLAGARFLPQDVTSV